VRTEYTYEPFGRSIVTGVSNTNPFQYTGRENDGTGLFYFRARYYHPTLQRFISEDPIEFGGGDANLYAYVGNSPVNLVDPTGLAGGPYHPPSGVHTACTEGDSCQTIQAKIWLLQRMIQSHEGWDRIMPSPRGGGRHSDEIAALWKQVADCQALYIEKCGGKECPPEPSPEPSTGPVPIPPFWWKPPIPSPERN
jgi:RHS repeat-associated protein